MTEAEIRAYWKDLHDTLSADYYDGTSGLSKEEFDTQHGQIWADMEAELIAEGYKQPPPESQVFIPVALPATAAKRIYYIEEFLKKVYPE